MVTAKERRLGIPRGDIERLMEHRGISAGEAEELLRIHSAETLLPQRGTGLLLGTAASLASPNPVFLKEQCYWPESIGVDEAFEAKWVVRNDGDAGQVWLGVRYKGVDYLPQPLDGQDTVPLDQGQTLTITKPKDTEGSIRTWLGELETWEESKTIEQIFLTGYFADGKFYGPTDTWTARTYVKVGAEFPIPIWALAAGGIVIGGGLLAWVVTRK